MKTVTTLFLSIAIVSAVVLGAATSSEACTNLLVTKGASADGAVMITYTCDGEFHPRLQYRPAADYPAGDSLAITNWFGQTVGWIPQVPHTYAVVGLMNEHQLAISETTFDGRPELEDTLTGFLGYFDLMTIALQRAKTAREAIRVMVDLANTHGYSSTGESISLADTREAWILEMIGKGPGRKGIVWVAVKVPDGYISCHANKARIGEFPLSDTSTCLHADDVISFAVEQGYYDPQSGQPFRFCEAYHPATPKNQRYADARVWSIFRRAAPSQTVSPDYHRGLEGAKPYPLWIKPDKKLSVADVFALMRDHYEGTPYDMTQGVDAGPYGTPNRWRPIDWTIDSATYVWERPSSTQQTGFSFVSQSRDWLPNPIGGVFWYGLDDTYTSCYTPLYCGITAVPPSFTGGTIQKFTWESAWWIFNFVANIANLKYSYMIEDILAVQREIEGQYLAVQPAVEKTALGLAADPAALKAYLTDYSVGHAERMVTRWKELGEFLLTKYNDGYVKNEKGRPTEKGYPEDWLRRVLRERPEQFRLPEKKADVPESKLID